MKSPVKSLLLGLGCLTIGAFNASADLEVSASVRIDSKSDFHAPLAAHGGWIEVGSYGRCWRPAHVAVEWRPYCYGHWVWTDCGWYWVSDEPWAWACYHYGSWVYDSEQGWIWVPGVEWAPAWVSWRVGGGYCGWAPLAPRGVVVAPRAFVFVDVRRFREPVRPATVIVNRTTIINQTAALGSPRHETRNFDDRGPQKVVVNEGPGLHEIEKATGKKVSPVPIRDASRLTPHEIARKTSPAESQDAPSGTPNGRNSAPERKPSPKEAPDISAKPTRPDADDQPRRGEIKPSPDRPPTPARLPEKQSRPPGRGKSRGG